MHIPHARVRLVAGVLAFGCCIPYASAEEFPRFRHVTIDADCGKVCYALTLADVNGDGRNDVVAATENRVLWYESPAWKRHVILENQTEPDNVCIAPHDIDGDGRVDFALGAGWTKVGTLQWISRGESPDDKWNVHFIGQERWLHRARFADVLGTGTPQLTISPLMATEGDGVRLTAFEIPADPRKDAWPRTVMDATLNRMHNHWHVDLDADGSVDTLAAGQQGIYLFRRSGDGFESGRLSTGAEAKGETPGGAGEVKTGRMKDGTPFIASVEPMHGNFVAVYTRTTDAWKRHVLEETLGRGHAVWPADVDGDGTDEIVIGHSEQATGDIKGPGVYIYRATDDSGETWTKHVVDDGGIAVEDAIAADLTGDGRVDIVAGGRDTRNIKLYVNEGP